MKKIKTIKLALAAVLAVVTVVVTLALYKSIKAEHDIAAKIEKADELVVIQLKKIRSAQILYFKVNREYASEWDTLIAFVQNGEVPTVSKRETVIALPSGRDSISVRYDTIRVEKAFDRLKGDLNCTREQVGALADVPLQEDMQFKLFTNRIRGIQVIEVSDPAPINPRRQEGGDWKALKIGSKIAATLKGNWE